MTYIKNLVVKSVPILFSLLFILASSQASSTSFVSDSLRKRIVDEKNDSIKLSLYDALFSSLRISNPKQALVIAKRHYYIAKSIENQSGIANAAANIGLANYSLGNYEEALENALIALKISESINDRAGIADALSNIGAVYSIQKQVALAIKYYQGALAIRLSLGDKKALAASYNSMGNAYQEMNNDSLALENYKQSYALRNEMQDKIGTAQSLNNMAIVYSAQGNFNKALDLLFQSLAIKQELNDLNGMAASYDNIGDVYAARYKANKSTTDMEQAIDYFNKSLSIARRLHLKEIIKICCESLAEIYHRKGDDSKAYAYYKEYSLVKDSLLNEHIALSETEMQSKYESEKKEKEIALLNKSKIMAESREKTQRLIIISGILFTIISLGFLLNRFIVKQRANNLLTQKNKLIDQNRIELRKQKEIIEQKNRDLTDSIDYAKQVQSLILPSEKEIQKLFPAAFVSFLPKSILSGDFYWYHKTEEVVLLAAIDCTGHGIPGAMMSFLGYNLLENVVKSQGIKSPGNVLRALNNEIFNTLSLKNENLNSKYGMDISFVSINLQQREIRFSGAHHPLYLVRKGELLEYKGDKFSLGTLYTGPEKEFTEHLIFYQPDDRLYLFSDGYPDQIGGNERKKFYYGPFKEALVKTSLSNTQHQKQQLEAVLNAWRGARDQTDDVLVMGIQL